MFLLAARRGFLFDYFLLRVLLVMFSYRRVSPYINRIETFFWLPKTFCVLAGKPNVRFLNLENVKIILEASNKERSEHENKKKIRHKFSKKNRHKVGPVFSRVKFCSLTNNLN